jgi:hypothetical protein
MLESYMILPITILPVVVVVVLLVLVVLVVVVTFRSIFIVCTLIRLKM